MDKQQIIDELNALTSDDPECSHGKADQLVAEALKLAGMEDVAKAYEDAEMRVGFWYA